MQLHKNAERIRIFIGENDKFKGNPLHEVLVYSARKMGIAGATVLRGVLGYGANSIVHSNKILRISEQMPLIVEVVDHPDKISDYLQKIEPMIQEGLITREDVQVMFYRHREKQS